jgi:ABC-type transport system involved in multi-copper enzyme maturation permease subunit
LITLYAVIVLAAGLVYESKEFPLSQIGHSLSRLLVSAKPTIEPIELKPSETNKEVVVNLSPVEVESLSITAEHQAQFQRLLPGMPGHNDYFEMVFPLDPGVPYNWSRSIFKDKNNPVVGKYFFSGDKIRFFVSNNTNQPNKVTASITATIEHPEVTIIPMTAAWVVGGALFYFLLRWAFPRVMAVAGVTMKETLYQPLFYIVLSLMLGIIFFQLFLPQNTFGDDVKPFKEYNLTVLTIAPIFLAIWTASHSIADEIEGKTALTLLSKPVSRVEFILGKYLGVMFPIVLLFCIAGAFFLGAIPFKVVYDARESANLPPDWKICFYEMRLVLPGMALKFMECMTLAAITVAISTRLSMLPNLLISFTIYALGHVLPLLVASSIEGIARVVVEFMARFFAAVLPVLDNYTIDAAITSGIEVPWSYLGVTLVYTIMYCAFALLGSLLLFEDRDLS